MSKTINGIVTWLRNWFYTKPEVDSLLGEVTTSLESDITSLENSITNINTTVNDHTDKFTDMIEVHNWDIPAFSLAKGTGVEKTVTVPNPSGYYRIPLIQGAYKCSASSLRLSGTTLTVKIQNHYTTNANASMYGIILYIKSSVNTEI